ncbi:MAG: VanZ family protein [Proteobacteria bacterium]|nr:VanZ family protein [Pseudomonadota bacterium]
MILFVVGILFLVFMSLFSELLPAYHRLFWRISLDNVLHFVAFAMLGVVAPLAFRRGTRAFGALFALMLLGSFMEYWQLYLPHRRCELIDASANILGIVVGGGLGFWLRSLCCTPRAVSS